MVTGLIELDLDVVVSQDFEIIVVVGDIPFQSCGIQVLHFIAILFA
jgi:hypothetical protein